MKRHLSVVAIRRTSNVQGPGRKQRSNLLFVPLAVQDGLGVEGRGWGCVVFRWREVSGGGRREMAA